VFTDRLRRLRTARFEHIFIYDLHLHRESQQHVMP
jgi:hypothetical protein